MEHPQAPVVILNLTWLEVSVSRLCCATNNRLGSRGGGRRRDCDHVRSRLFVGTEAPRSFGLCCSDRRRAGRSQLLKPELYSRRVE